MIKSGYVVKPVTLVHEGEANYKTLANTYPNGSDKA